MKCNHCKTIVMCITVLLALNGGRVDGVDCHTEIDPYYKSIDVMSLIHISTPEDAASVRKNIIDYFWPEGFPATKMPASVQRLPEGTGDSWPAPDDISLPTDGLVGHWKFDGNTNDSSGGNNAIVQGPVTAGTDNGVVGGAVRFAGGGYLSLPVANAGEDWTVMCWVKADAGNEGMFLTSAYEYYDDGVRGWESIFLRYYAGGSRITGAIDWPGWRDHGRDGHIAETPISPAQWRHVAITYESSTHNWKFYMNGDMKDSGSVAFPGWFNNAIILGGSLDTEGLIFDYVGLLDDMRLYNRVVQSDEIQIADQPLTIPDWILSLGSENLKAVDRLDIAMDYDMHSYVYHLHPMVSNNRVLIFQQGHSNILLNAGGHETVKYFLDKGYSIFCFWMPLLGENSRTARGVPGHGDRTFTCATGSCTDAHNQMSAVLENSAGSFIRFFIEPVVVAINYAKSSYGYHDISMTGISGGGWATHVCAAVDPRIRQSFAVAGALPLYLRSGPCPNGSQGDAEQIWAPLFEQRASWLDIYILAGWGKDRVHVHILNQYDTCCFWGVNYRTFEPFAKDSVMLLEEGSYSVFLDSSHREHKISEEVIVKVIDKHLSSCGLGAKGDINDDCIINFSDFAMVAANWLGCSYVNAQCP